MKVPVERIMDLMEKVEVITEVKSKPTPYVVTNIWLGNYHLSSAISKSIDPSEFDEELGKEYSRNEALGKAQDKLWELEGYLHLSKNKFNTVV